MTTNPRKDKPRKRPVRQRRRGLLAISEFGARRYSSWTADP